MSKIHISISADYSESDFRLVQLEECIVDALKSGEAVYIKGEIDGQCVLSSDSKSYCIEKIDTSNTVLFVEQITENSYSIKGTYCSILELDNNPIDIQNILCHIPIYDDISDSSILPVNISTLEELCLYSNKEICEYIRLCCYVFEKHDGTLFRMSHRQYYKLVLDLINQSLLSHISLSSFALDSLLDRYLDVEYLINKHLIQYLLDDLRDIDNHIISIPKHNLIQAIIKAVFLHISLQSSGWLSATDLQKGVSTLLPTDYDFDLQMDESCLVGVVIKELHGSVLGYRFIDKDMLLMKPEDRFFQLFSIESEWSQEDLLPYIANLELYGFGKPGDLLIKYCREVNVEENGVSFKHFVLKR